jgi:hypothetical protein
MTEPTLRDVLEISLARCRDPDVPLADRLQAFADELRRVGPEFASAVDVLVNRLEASGAGATAPSSTESRFPRFAAPLDLVTC